MNAEERVKNLIRNGAPELKEIGEKVLREERISPDEGLVLYEKAELGLLGTLADYIRVKRHGEYTYFNRNFHIEPTNLCVFDCKFCSYARNFKYKEEAWELTIDEMLEKLKNYDGKPVTEVHIVGGVHPKMTLDFFCELLSGVRELRPELHIKAFTAIELEFMFRKAKVSVREGLLKLKEHGLNSIPGGGAEIFDNEIREKICKDKATSEQWIEIHKTAHELGIPSNATMLYGHYESYHHRIDHMERLRQIQDETKGFNTFIPLKFRNENNAMSHLPEVSVVEDLKAYAIGRIYLDNFPHLKAYWPMIGRTTAQLLLAFGVDDIDGTIDDSTKIYSMAGAEEQTPALSTRQLVELIKQVGRHPVERDTLYNIVNDYSQYDFSEEAVTI